MDYERLRDDLMNYYDISGSILRRISGMMDCELLAFAFDSGIDISKYSDYGDYYN